MQRPQECLVLDRRLRPRPFQRTLAARALILLYARSILTMQ
jgi:hypothetical protein